MASSVARPVNSAGEASGASGGFSWGALESTNYATYIANLRSVGCPRETIEDIVLADINKLYGRKLAESRTGGGAGHYWEGRAHRVAGGPDRQSELIKEKNALIKELLGIDLEAASRAADPSSRAADERVAFLPEAQRQSVRAWENKYDGLRRQIYANAKGALMPEDRAALAAIEKQKAAEFNGILTPEQRFEYDVRTSPSADMLRNQLDAIQPNEQEFRSLYQAQAALDAKLASLPGDADDGGKAAGDAGAAARQEYDAQIKTILGDERYAQYQLSQNPDYGALARLTDRYGLDADVAGQVLSLKDQVQAQAQQLSTNTDLVPEQRQAALQAIQAQAQSALTGLLGQQAMNAYKDQGGWWLKRLGPSESLVQH
jgi:hypothetical protein